MDLLRLMTAGSVDDGKSTLIGRLFYDTGKILKDQMGAIERASKNTEGAPNLAFFTDGLKAERERGITIDVAYRYFSSDKRKFILADAPGHLEFTKNMITAASHSDVALILVDATQGVFPQTKRHAWVARWMGLKIVFCINKMDLVDHSEKRFEQWVQELCRWMKVNRNHPEIAFIPVSALHGENIVNASTKMPWYKGASLFSFLETLQLERANIQRPIRFPIQWTIENGFAGSVASGVLRTGKTLRLARTGANVTIQKIVASGMPVKEALPAQAILIYLSDATKLSRGDLLEEPTSPTLSSPRWEVELCYLKAAPLEWKTEKLRARFTSLSLAARIISIADEFHLDSLEWLPFSGEQLHSNHIVRATIEFEQNLYADSFEANPATGRMILIHEESGDTAAAVLLRRPLN